MAFPVHRFQNLKTHTFDVEVVTPLFLSGADQNTAELRPPSLKGMLRFWWRALYGRDSIKDMKEEEAKIFGDTDHKSDLVIRLHNTSNCRSVLTNINKGKTITVQSQGKTFPISIIEYLAYGLYEYKKGSGNVFTKHHFQPGDTKFTIQTECSNKFESKILNVLKILHCFGGIGSRNRNGFGVLNFLFFSNNTPEDTFLQIKTGHRKKFTAFSSDSRLFLFKEQVSWAAALSDAGIAYRTARTKLENKHHFQRRPLIAKPLIVKKEKINIKERHAKPYFLHVHKMANGKFRGQILFMPYKYHDVRQQENYDKACRDMNTVIRQSKNFEKEISAGRREI